MAHRMVAAVVAERQLVGLAPSAVASSWWPRQMPNTGTRPSRSAMMPIWTDSAAGSPGPLERKTPSGSRARASSAEKSAGTTVTVASASSPRSMVCFTPKS